MYKTCQVKIMTFKKNFYKMGHKTLCKTSTFIEISLRHSHYCQINLQQVENYVLMDLTHCF